MSDVNLAMQRHKSLEKAFFGSDISEKLDFFGLLIEILANQFSCDGVSFFEYNQQERFLEMRLHYRRGITFEDEESLFVEHLPHLQKALYEKEPQSVKIFGTYFLYVPFTVRSCRMEEEENEDKTAFIRLERQEKAKAFSKTEIKRIREKIGDFLRNFYQTEFLSLNKKYVQNLYVIKNLSEIFARSLRVRESFNHILKGLQRHFGFDRIRLYLVEEKLNKLQGVLSVDILGKVKSLEFEQIPLEKNSHRLADIILERRLQPFFDKHTQKVLYVPLVVQSEIIGLMIVDNMLSQQDIEETEFAMLKAFAGQIALVVDNVQLFEKIEELSLYDELTNLPLRRYFHERFQEEMYRADRFSQPMAVVWGDIDYFKQINDNYGHQVGDRALKEVSRVIMANLRKIDFPCRYGGDEVLIMLPQASGNDALKFVERLIEEIKEIRIEVPFSRYKYITLSMSFGIATFPQDATTAEDLLQKADDALYWVKSRNRGQVTLYSDIKTQKERGQS